MGSKPKLSMTTQVFIGLVVGLILGWIINSTDPQKADIVKPFSDVFLRLIKMIVAPLIFSTLVAGIAGVEKPKEVGRMGVRAVLYFEIVTTAALVIGLVVVNVFKPGAGVMLPQSITTEVHALAPRSWQDTLLHTFPESMIKAMAENDVLQVVVFSIFFALGLGKLKEAGKPLLAVFELVAKTMFNVTHSIMKYAPIGVAAAMAYVIGHNGFGVLKNLAALVGTLYFALFITFLFVLLPGAWVLRIPVKKFLMAVREPALIAFSTSSSEAALPRAMEVLEEFGVPRKVVSFVLPLGYSFNLVGSTLYLSLASIFVAQAAGIELTVGQQITMLLTLMLTSKGVAAVSRATLVVIAATLATYKLPLEGVTLILGVDAIMDMGRSLLNVIGNCLATVIVAKWEGVFPETAGSLPPVGEAVPSATTRTPSSNPAHA